jgi:hypothetical protein
MRRRVNLVFFLLLLVASPLILFSRFLAFTQLFFEHAGIGITQDHIARGHAANQPNHTAQLIPRIIHRIFHDWHNQSMPADWEEARQTCIDANPDWKDMVSHATPCFCVPRRPYSVAARCTAFVLWCRKKTLKYGLTAHGHRLNMLLVMD